MATHSSTLAWKIPWMEESGGLSDTWPGLIIIIIGFLGDGDFTWWETIIKKVFASI